MSEYFAQHPFEALRTLGNIGVQSENHPLQAPERKPATGLLVFSLQFDFTLFPLRLV
jgi:hypothetical protein